MKRKVLVLSLFAIILSAVGAFLHAATPTAQNPRPKVVREQVKALKATDEWAKMSDQLAQYTNHLAQFQAAYTTATGKVDLVGDAATKLALQKMLAAMDKLAKMVDDLYATDKAQKRVIVDTVELQ